MKAASLDGSTFRLAGFEMADFRASTAHTPKIQCAPAPEKATSRDGLT